MTALSDMLAGLTPDEVRTHLLELATIAGFPASAWQEFSAGRTFFEIEKVPYADLAGLAGSIAGSGFLDFAAGGWLDLCAQGFYATTRQPGERTRGSLLLTDAGGAGPFEIQAGDVVAQAPGGLKFVSTTGGTLDLNGELPLDFAAESPGAAYNLADGVEIELVTSFPGVTIETNTPPGDTWITTQGADVESDEALRARCRLRWGELGYGATSAAYLRWALTASAEVTRVGLQPSTGDGIVYLYAAGPNGPVSGAALTALSLYIQERLPLCVRASIASAVAEPIAVSGSAKVRAAYLASAKVRAVQNIQRLFATIPVGGVVYRSQIEQAVMNASPGMIDCVLTLDTATQLLASQVAVAEISGLMAGWFTG
jgi:uncharacterized phage protein gp47/JayE